MSLKEYVKDKCLFYVLHICCMFAAAGFLRATGYPRDCGILILICWILVVAVVSGVDYGRRKKYFQEMQNILERAEQRYLLGELMPDSERLEDRLYRDMIRVSNKSVIEHIRGIEQEKREYQEFIERWVHEVKGPLTGISLICGNDSSDSTRRIERLNRKVETYVEMALYYARSDVVYKDYMLREEKLQDIVSEVLAGNKWELLEQGISVEAACEGDVYTDRKWIIFILNQLILNSVKYKRESGAWIKICAEGYPQGVRMAVRDNGTGIREEELPRIFEKGFTGTNGRGNEHSTGMGLYLCRILAEKLGIAISACSKEGEGTEITICFPVGDYHARK